MSEMELIDWEQLSMIFGDEGDELDEDMAELFHEFVEDGNERFVAIRSADFATETEVIAKEAHKLKGSASNFGFARVAGLLGHIEDDIATLTGEDYERSLNGAFDGFERSVEALVARFPGLAVGQS